MKFCFLFLNIFFSTHLLFAQDLTYLFKSHLETEAKNYAPFDQDFNDYIVTHHHNSKNSKLTHIYLNQRFNGLEIKNAVLSLHLNKEGGLIHLNNQFLVNLSSRIHGTIPQITALDAIKAVAKKLHIGPIQGYELLSENLEPPKFHLFRINTLSQEDIPVKLIYQPTSTGEIKLAWDLSILVTEGSDWWSIRVDALNGEILDQENWTNYCNFNHGDQEKDGESYCVSKKPFTKFFKTSRTENNVTTPNSYNIFPIGTESPNHGSRELVLNPAHLIASPYGWHDTDGSSGAEYTSTKGNNVETKDDILGDNETTIGSFADGTTNLTFDFALNTSLPPSASINASLTNLFYWNNIMHDVWYQYGFDESAGNFQQNNYGRGGIGNDFVRSDGLDGEGINNANFSTPGDGTKPRMQMFLWNNSINALSVTINTPVTISGNYSGAKAAFGPSEYNLSGNIVLANPILGCSSLSNATDINGNIAMIDRGSCEFGTKCLTAQNAGAIAVIICNNTSDAPISMGAGMDGNLVNIPCIMLSQANCNLIKLNLPGVHTMLIGTDIQIDGSFDNGIIAHEYGHGISNRLTGGAANVSCLNNNEQMGEGWSDWFGLMVTMKEGDSGVAGRGIGTFALGQPVSGNGIRTYKYSSDMVINPQTYDFIKTASIPHGVGSVWCTILWDMTWLLIDIYGFDADYYHGTGGNNIAMNLVTEALKLQPCSPGFVDGRNALLLADDVLYGGIHKCLIWKAFAGRGLGFSANQGLSSSRSDGTQAFDMPSFCCNQVYIKDNSGIGSLRYALDCVSSGGTISFASYLDNKKIELYEGLTINKDINIISTSPNGVKIATNNTSPTLTINNFNIVLQNLTICGGSASSGRALKNHGNLTCNDVTFIDEQGSNVTESSIINYGTIIFNGINVLKK